MADYPFLHPAFFDALERGGAATPEKGWRSQHIQVGDGWLPAYLKSHNRGEYVFDYAWANAYAEHGLDYFPRLVSAVPFTPITGPRWRGNFQLADLRNAVVETLAETGASSWHLLFPDEQTREALQEWPLAERLGCHFRWFNRDYQDFDHFMQALTSRRRKAIRKERQGVAAQGLTVCRAVGAAIPDSWWQHFYQCYAATYLKRGQVPYLTPAFFELLRRSELLEQLMLVVAYRGEALVAAAFYLFDDERLYGRYWGCLQECDGLHFELCYYQGIAFACERGLTEFDPGVQGEHKILRGFEPVITRSLHWIREPAFRRAIEDFCVRESAAVRSYRDEATTLLPYRQV